MSAVILNNVDHQDLKLVAERGAEFGDAVNGCLVFPEEFIHVHKEYPIYFQKSEETGQFQAVALFGFEQGENLFLSSGQWNARYIPAIIRREPFYIGLSNSDTNSGPVVLVDLESPRVSKSDEGVQVFKESGGNTAVLDDANQALGLVHNGQKSLTDMFALLSKLELIEQFELDITFDNGSTYKTNMFYTINQEKFSQLDASIVLDMHRGGALQITYMVLESLSNIKHLIKLKNSLA